MGAGIETKQPKKQDVRGRGREVEEGEEGEGGEEGGGANGQEKMENSEFQMKGA